MSSESERDDPDLSWWVEIIVQLEDDESSKIQVDVLKRAVSTSVRIALPTVLETLALVLVEAAPVSGRRASAAWMAPTAYEYQGRKR